MTFTSITPMSIPHSTLCPTRTYSDISETNPQGYTLSLMSTHERSNRV
uniref:Uncharacterized protein n=1 Tax=Lepeophtheirus salmonis TaxID=72036 RepID=A0A0K2UQ19_LEPSM